MTQTILTFGDSNTHGTPPIVTRGLYARHDATIRWPQIMAAQTGCTLIEEGLPGRTACPVTDPEMGAHMNGHLGLRIALESHGPIDVLTLMLGTNDCKAHFGLTPEGIAAGIAGLLAIACGDVMQTRHGGFRTLLICPPPVLEQGPIAQVFHGGAARSQGLAPLYADLARVWHVGFLNAGRNIAVSPQDGVHYDADAHHTLGLAVAQAIAAL
ncbi:Lysophospholipase L1 [Loktanella fryxellensis]|uniref:Lysophospholipase L1 n=1 Tax=Loktanella fryxellensis TaxID=245187 RepID=A0A1H8E9X0_9RHOB|nr:GDSL-type esterase/lipase family protein [Loktanella fryxellensis]SEN15637.1 Lysophospholipase L1 [Loktanella fryxellensis]